MSMPKKVHRVLICIPAMLASLLSGQITGSSVVAAVGPDQEIRSVNVPAVPEWKKYWDTAREFVRKGQNENAANAYRKLFLEKPQIEEARWEYCKVLFALKDYATLLPILESLIESDAQREEYLAMAGKIALAKGEYPQAATYLGQVYTLHPEGQFGTEILENLVQALQGLGNTQIAFPLMEQLYLRNKNNQHLLLMLARYARGLGKDKKAREYYTTLVEKFQVEDAVLLEAAAIFDFPGLEQEALPVFQKYLERHPEYLPFHQKISTYYLNKGKNSQALPHVVFVLDHSSEKNSELLLMAARIYREDENRSDKALQYLERFLALHPDRQDIVKEIQQIRTTLAKNLLAIIENDGAQLLWQDLEKLNIDRLAIYRIMAAELEKSGKTVELAGVLAILAQYDPDKDKYALKLAGLHSAMNEYKKSLDLLDTISIKEYKTFDYYRDKGKLEEKLNLIEKALYSDIEALKLQPRNDRLRSHALSIAGTYGAIKELRQLILPLQRITGEPEHLQVLLDTIENLRMNGLFSEAETVYSRLFADMPRNPPNLHRLRLHQAETLTQEGRMYDAEGVLRGLLAEEKMKPELVKNLIDHAISAEDADSGWKWFKFLTGLQKDQEWRNRYDADARWMVYRYAELKAAGKDFAAAIQELNTYKLGMEKNLPKESQSKNLLFFDKLLARLYLERGDTTTARNLLYPYLKTIKDDSELNALHCFARDKQTSPALSECSGLHQESQTDKFLTLVVLAETGFQLGKLGESLGYIDKALAVRPDSLRARTLKARYLNDIGRSSESLDLYRSLKKDNPNEAYFQDMYLQVLFKIGNYPELISNLTKNVGEKISPSEKLLLARALWGEGKNEEALKAYESLLENSARQEYLKKVNPQAPQPVTKTDSGSVWDIFMFSGSEELAWLDKITDPSGFVAVLDQPESRIAADFYPRFRWERIVMNEYIARKAIMAKKFITAEKQYKKTVKEEKSPVALQDLAGIYKRLGSYGKEAEVYTALAKQGQQSPDLDESMERNKLTRSPRLSMDIEKKSMNGRENAIDLKKQSNGASFWFMPQTSSEVSILFAELTYTSHSEEKSALEGRKLQGKWTVDLSEDTSIHADFGLHMLDSESDTTMVYNLGIEHHLDEFLKSYFTYHQDIIDDTLTSLEESMTRQGFTAGLKLEAPSGFNIGGEFRRLSYSDENSQNRMYLWSAYDIFSEYTTYELKYSYELQKETLSNIISVDDKTGERDTSLPYWSPGNYWLHRLNLHFQQLLKGFPMFEKAPSYYAVDLSVGYESGESMLYSGSFDIFLEMSSHFLLKGNLLNTQTDDYDERGASLSVIYRW
jgi:tetratricopeptide (TPR) repeat protein